MKYKDIRYEVKALDDDGAGFEGHASVFSTVDRVGDIVVPGAFKDTLPTFLADGVVVWQHNWSQPIGRPVEAHEDEKGLFIKATLSDTAAGRECRTLMKDGVIKKLSFGYDIVEAEKLTPQNIATYCSVEQTPPDRLEQAFKWGFALKRLELFEVSPVSVPAHPDADVSAVKARSQTGRRFDEHSVAVLAAVKDYVDRLEDLRADRGESGRSLSKEHFSRMEALLSGLGEAMDRLKALSAPAEGAKDEQAAARDAHAQLLALESRLLGVGI
jgi:HK97 family phage prohead protease